LKRVGEKRPWLSRADFVYEPSWGHDFVPKEAQLVNGIHPDHCIKFGRPLCVVAMELINLIREHGPDAVVGHNIRSYDMPFLLHHLSIIPGLDLDTLNKVPVIDTMRDIEYPKHCKSKALTYLCADHGFLIDNAHSALFDVLATLRLAEHYDLKSALLRGQEPSHLYKAKTRHPKEDNGASKDKAKALGFAWQNYEGREFPLSWVKRIRNSELESVVAELGFGVMKIE
jgi:DNA polymerase III epsilon subunit-like protein